MSADTLRTIYFGLSALAVFGCVLLMLNIINMGA